MGFPLGSPLQLSLTLSVLFVFFIFFHFMCSLCCVAFYALNSYFFLSSYLVRFSLFSNCNHLYVYSFLFKILDVLAFLGFI